MIDNKKDDILEKLVHINRITKVVKGGRRFGFSALVVVGNQNGKIGIAHAKAKQVPDAIKKANEMARRKLTHIPLREGRTIHHDVRAKDGAGRIVFQELAKINNDIKNGYLKKNKSLNKCIDHAILSKKNIENYKKSGKIYLNNFEKLIQTFISIFDLIKLSLTNKNDNNIQHDHLLINEEINLDERI